jgi:hypothetical protein
MGEIAGQMLAGHVRSAHGGVTVDQIIAHRDRVTQEIKKRSRAELETLDIVVDAEEIEDTSDYIGDLAAPPTSAVARQASPTPLEHIAPRPRAGQAASRGAASNVTRKLPVARVDSPGTGPGQRPPARAVYWLTKLCAGKMIGSSGLSPACWTCGISAAPKAWNFSADSQTSSTQRPSGVTPTTWDRQPPPGQSASERSGWPLFSARQTSSYCSVVPPGNLKITPMAMRSPSVIRAAGSGTCPVLERRRDSPWITRGRRTLRFFVGPGRGG